MARMTDKEFLRRLRKVPSKWKVSENGEIRTKRPLFSFTPPELLCPISAVCKHIKGESNFIGDWRIDAEEIGLRKAFADKVVDAADGNYGELRKKLLKVTGLKERK